MVLRIIGVLSFLLFIHTAEAQLESNTGSARGSALAGQGITFRGGDALFLNQAGLASSSNFEILAYGDNRFGVSGLGSGGIAFLIPAGDGAFGLRFNRFGYETYKEQKVGLAYGLPLSKYLDVGLQVDWLQTGVSDLNSNSFTAEFGLIAHLAPKVDLAFHVFNPFDFFEDQNLELRIPTQFRLGLEYRLAEEIILLAEANKLSHRDPNLKLAIEYGFAERFYARLGFGFKPQNTAFGLGFKIADFRIDLSGSAHQALGFSPQLGVLWTPNSK